jgi:hypothetical protein
VLTVSWIRIILIASLWLATSAIAQMSVDDYGKRLVDSFVDDIETFSGEHLEL